MNILIACERSGIVRNAFRARGHNAWSCDIELADDSQEFHLKQNVLEVLDQGWDLMIAHPPCTYLTVSRNRWFNGEKDGFLKQELALKFFWKILCCGIKKKCIENPIGVTSSRIRPPDQMIQPWEFGHGETKKTGLWLSGLPPLQPTNIVEGREQKILNMGKKQRAKRRSQTYLGIANAMAEQWG